MKRSINFLLPRKSARPESAASTSTSPEPEPYSVPCSLWLVARMDLLPGTWRTEFAPHPGWRIPTMTFVAPPTTSGSSVAKAWSANSRTPTDTLFLSKPSVPSQRSSSYEKNCSVPSLLPFTKPETATNPKTVLQSTNTTRICAETCSSSCRTSESQPSNRQDFVDLDFPSASNTARIESRADWYVRSRAREFQGGVFVYFFARSQ